jgi:methionine-rich copper-binding protein CopC
MRHRRLRRSARPRRLYFEELEPRDVPAVTSWPGLTHPVVEAEGNDTLNLANDLGSASGRLEAVGTVGTGAAGAADVDWYKFTLTQAATVRLTTLDRQGGSALVSVLGLYGRNPTDPTNFSYQFRLIAQDDGAARGGDAVIEYNLAPDTYWVAVSGSGNRYFHPHVAGSGLDGSTGNYGLLITTTDLDTPPTILATDPADGAVLAQSPLAVRARLSAALSAGETITLRDANDDPVSVTTNYNASIKEVRLILRRALAEGTYRISLRDVDGTELEGSSFTVGGVEGVAGAGDAGNDTAATAIDLGNVIGSGLIQRTGAIGDDPFYDPLSDDPLVKRQAADVDLYQFHISGPGRYALITEVFSQRLGLGLNPGLSLFRRNELTGQLEIVAGNNNTYNPTRSTLNTAVLQFDPALFVRLTAGDYYLAVSATGNVPDPLLGLEPGSNGIFDPNTAHSGSAGTTTGAYVLNLLVHPDDTAPRVTATTPAAGTALTAPPTLITVQFDEPVNLQQLAYAQYQQEPGTVSVPAVFVRGPDGVDYVPRFVSYDPATNQATFLMLDPLPNGVSELHLAPGQGFGGETPPTQFGLADLAGNPLVANDASGDYVARFTVAAAPRGTADDPQVWLSQDPNDSLDQPRAIGALFPNELQNGVVFRRDFTNYPMGTPADTEDFYRFEVLQQRTYIFTLPSSSGLPPGTKPQLYGPDGSVINVTLGAPITLAPGTYTVRLGGWADTAAPQVTYDLRISLGASAEGPTPLTAGPGPALRIRLTTAPADPGAPNTPVTPPAVRPTNVLAQGTSFGLLLDLRAGPIGGVESGAAAGRSSDRLVLSERNPGPGKGLGILALTLTVGGHEEGLKAEGEAPLHEALQRLFQNLGDLLRWASGVWPSVSRLADPPPVVPAEGLLDEVFGYEGETSSFAMPGPETSATEDGDGEYGFDMPDAEITASDETPAPAGEWAMPLLPVMALGLVAPRSSRGRRQSWVAAGDEQLV